MTVKVRLRLVAAACGLFAGLFGIQALGAASPQSGGPVPVLLELFTSEGCSSCPPADALLMRLDRLQPVPGARIIVLSEHVDYWNSLGWRDPFSSAAMSQRQAAYARHLGSEVFTPQLVIDGREQFVGSDEKSIRDAIARAAAKPKSAIRITQTAREASSAAVTLKAAAGRGTVWVAIAGDRDESSVTRGENAGKTIPHVAVLRSLNKAGSLNGKDGWEKTVRLPLTGTSAGPLRIVVFIERDGAIAGADSALLGDSL